VRFIIDADLPHSLTGIIERFGHEALHVGDVGLGGAPDEQIAAFAQSRGLALVTGDFGFGDVRNYPPGEYAGIVILVIPQTAGLSMIQRLTVEFLQAKEVIESIEGKLAIVEVGRIRVRG
jgi:predicted nuclease of predicted toxin-antitoxin system